MKFYVGTSLANKEAAAALTVMLERTFGWHCTYKWFDVGEVDESQRAEIATLELKGVMDADVFIGVLPGKLGMHTEFGAAIANPDKICIIAAPDDTYFVQGSAEGYHPSIFYYLPGVTRIVYYDNMSVLMHKLSVLFSTPLGA